MSRRSRALATLLLLVACEKEPPDLDKGHVRFAGEAGRKGFALRAREYGYALVDDEGALRARLVLPRNQAVAKAFIVAGPVRIDLSGSLVNPRGERLRMDVSPHGIQMIEESGQVAHRLRVNWPRSRSVSVFDRNGTLVGTAVEAEPARGGADPRAPGAVALTGADGKPVGRVEGLPARAAAFLLLPGLDDLERSVLAIYLIRFR